MLLVGYCFDIRSERRLCGEVHLNLACRWFCRLDLFDPVPNHSTFSKNRHRRFRESKLLRHLFEKTVTRCIEDRLVSGQRLAADASLIEADANKQNPTPKEDWDHSATNPSDAPRAVRECLDVLEPPQTSQDLSCTAATAKSLIRKARAPSSRPYFLQPQHVVFPQNGRIPVIRRKCEF